MSSSSVENGKMPKAKKNFVGKFAFLVIVLLALLGIAFMIFKRITKKVETDFKAIPSVNVTHVRKGSIEKDISLMGNILPSDTYYVVAKVGGDIKKVYVKNGDFVKKGDPICEIDASKEIEAAFIQYDTAKKSYERMLKLYNAGDISLQNFESVKAQYDGYKLAYETKLEYSVPVAVADGVVENTNMTENTSIRQETVLCYITSEESKEINFGVTERVLNGIKLNDKVKVEKNGAEYDGYISNISNLINSTNGLFNVKAVITSENSFASGIMAKVTFPYIKKNNVNLLPNELIYYEAGMPYIFTVGKDNIIVKKYIEVGIENVEVSEVLTELDKSLKIVSTWNNDLAEGTLVNVVKDEEVTDDIVEIEEVTESISEEAASEVADEINVEVVEEASEDDAAHKIATKSEVDVEDKEKEKVSNKISLNDKKTIESIRANVKETLKETIKSFKTREIPSNVKIVEVE